MQRHADKKISMIGPLYFCGHNFFVAGLPFADFLPGNRQAGIDRRRSGNFLQGLIMSLKKYFKRCGLDKSGQAVLEYFILLALLAAFTIIASSVFFSRAQGSSEHFEEVAFNKMVPNVN